MVDSTLLWLGFFNEGAVSIRPENLNYLNYFENTRLNKLPKPCPIRKTGVFE